MKSSVIHSGNTLNSSTGIIKPAFLLCLLLLSVITSFAQEGKDTSAASGNNESKPASIKAYSKFDFIPGEKIVAFEDFMQDGVGDFPAKWNTNSTAEIVTIEGKPGQWLMLHKEGVFMPEFFDTLPDNFTLEFDLLGDNPGKLWALYTAIVSMPVSFYHWHS